MRARNYRTEGDRTRALPLERQWPPPPRRYGRQTLARSWPQLIWCALRSVTTSFLFLADTRVLHLSQSIGPACKGKGGSAGADAGPRRLREALRPNQLA